ncbi:MAG: polyphosphate kinase 2 family protein [Bacteroidia bacterium]
MPQTENFYKDKNIAVNDGKGFKLGNLKTNYTGGFKNENDAEKKLKADIEELSDLQEKLYASDKHSILIIFQAMDAAGKDSTIEHVLKGINPQGCHITSFKRPSDKELSHDFLWRTTNELPERGMIGIFNRSYYEEVLVTKVHPEIILGQTIPGITKLKQIDNDFWDRRYHSIRQHEKHLIENGYIILKFFLNVSKEEQKNRFLDRINDPAKNWKFQYTDIKEREFWDMYMSAYEKAIKETATEDAPWFVIPADNKWFMRTAVCDIILNTLEQLNLKFPDPNLEQKQQLAEAKNILTSFK